MKLDRTGGIITAMEGARGAGEDQPSKGFAQIFQSTTEAAAERRK
ncbi:MAG TPA: hypothetical protein VMT53_15935 [Terriglobales bacterium]|nr:hypothetical protein [Terriglobales bacterium]